MKSSLLLAFLCAMCLALFSAPASAQATRTWVSGVGDDANPCSRTAPCKTFAGAISRTAASGEIDCLDPGGFGAVTITKAITILCRPVSNGGVVVSGTNGIVVAAGPSDKVVLDGLDFEGLAPAPDPGLNGVQVNSGAVVYIIHCTIRDFAQNGVNVTSTTAGTRVLIKDSFLENNGAASGPSGGGVNVQGGGGSNSADIVDTLIDGSAAYAIQVGSVGNTIAIANSMLGATSNNVAISNLGGSVISFGPSNAIAGAGSPTQTISFK